MSATSYRRPTTEIIAEIERRMRALKVSADPGAAAAFDRVELFDAEDLVEAFRYLLITEQRVCVIVPLTEEFETQIDGLKLVVTRSLPVAVLMSDRVLGSRKAALYGRAAGDDGTGAELGAYALLELALPELTGLLLANPNGVMGEPQSDSVLSVRDTEKNLPNRVCVALELRCRGGRLEGKVGPGVIW